MSIFVKAVLKPKNYMTQITKFKIYSSSAGSGKTYTLAKEYIKLALKSTSPWYFNHILAVTFTNKAAEEMKERILKYLHQFSSNDPKLIEESNELLGTILQELQEEGLKIDEWELRQRASKTFKHIIHEYANFSVSTIDSFVQRIVSAFTEELNFPFNFEVNLDSNVLLDGAVEQLFQKVNTENFEQITQALESFAMEKAAEGKSWNNLPAELAAFGKNLLADQHQDAIEKLTLLKPNDFLTIEKQLKGYCEYTETKLKTIATVCLETIETAGLSELDFYQGKSGVGVYFKKVQQTDVFQSANSYVQKALNEDTWYSKSAKPPIKATIDSISEELGLFLTQLLQIQASEKPKYVLFKLLIKQLKKLSLLNQLKKEISDIQDDTGQIHISEFNRKILEIVMSEPIPFIYERLGERYNHILIDEFQDTSTLQWHNFLPLIENSLASNHFNLAVGDAKQSIYRFRGGEMELIVHLHKNDLDKLIVGNEDNMFLMERYESMKPYLKAENLTTNYRSAENIIDFNNRLFNDIKSTPENEVIAPSLSQVYDDSFEQKIPDKPKVGGHVQIDFLSGKITDDQMYERVKQQIDTILADGFSYSDIAVLCRKNKHARNIANLLNKDKIEVISTDSLSLGSSEVVNFTIAMMKVVQNPENSLAKYEAIYLFYQLILNKIPTIDENKLIKKAIDSKDIKQYYQLINDTNEQYTLDYFSLPQMGLYELAEKFINTFELFKHHKDLNFIFRFLDVVIEYQSKKSTHLIDFLQFWELKKNDLSISTSKGLNAITVSSIHRSKGLEYPVVIIPYCNWTMDVGLRDVIWATLPDEDELTIHTENTSISLQAAPLTLSKPLTETAIGKQYIAEREKIFLESLNMLYVAVTRPTTRLYMITSKDAMGFDKSVGNQLYRFAGCPAIEEGQHTTTIIHQGSPKIQKVQQEQAQVIIEIDAINSVEGSNKVKLRQSAERLFDLVSFEKSKDYGNKVHAAFAKIKTFKDVALALQEILREGLIIETEISGLKTSLLSIMNLPDIKPLFEIDEIYVKNEREILMPEGKPLRPDRVVKLKDKIVIVDYKTGSKSNSHQSQVRQYMNIYRDMGYPRVEGILIYLEGQEIVTVQ